METHIGGNLDDTIQEYNNQKDIIEKNNSDYMNFLNINSKNKRDQNNDLQFNEKYQRNFRINDIPTIIDKNINISNPIIYPKEYDQYFNYLDDKNLNPINNQVVLEKTCININSENRTVVTTSTDEFSIMLANNSLLFENDSSVMTIMVDNTLDKFLVNDIISLTGFDFYTKNYKNMKFYFKNNSDEVILNINPNFNAPIPYYNIMIRIENVTNNNENFFKNIPLNVINITTPVISFDDNGDMKFKFKIPIPFYTTNDLDSTLTSNCVITFLSLGNYPINLINAKYPITEYNLMGSYSITNVSKTYIQVKLFNPISILNTIEFSETQGYWKNNIFYTGGSNVQISKITNIEKGYINISDYRMQLKKIINNVVNIRMISSEFPDTQKIINSKTAYGNITVSNNNFYWANALDTETYNITIPVGNYTANELEHVMMNLISKVKRIFVNSTNIYPYNDMTIKLDTDSNITSIASYNNFILPDCLVSITNDSIIKINQNQHDLREGDTIIINKSLDYYKISKTDINKEHVVTKILDSNTYEITLININLITDVGNTLGGKEIIIKTKNSFKLFFNKSNTCGNQIGFKYVGLVGSVTPYSNIYNNYTITNLQPYILDLQQILTVTNKTVDFQQNTTNINLNGYNYFLILCNNFNLNSNLNSIDYFYKIQLNKKSSGDILYNTFVDNAITFNPPLKKIESLSFKFYDPKGNLFDFYGINHSFTLEITNITNYPENTNINTFTSRI